MPLDFPNTPVLNDTFTSAGKTWQYNGSAWVLVVGAAAIAVGAVTDDKIASGAVIEAKIGTGAVTETKIGTGAVTEAKVGTGAVTETKIGASAVTVTKIGTGAVTAPKLSAGTATNNYVLTADSVQTSGMKWAIIPPSGGLSTSTEGAIMTMAIGA